MVQIIVVMITEIIVSMDINNYTFDIIDESEIGRQDEKFLKHFLANSSEEAVEVYKSYSELLNDMAHSYSVFTGLSRRDLFGEGVIGLSKAVRDWDPKRENKASLKTYALYKIRDELNEFVRKNSGSIIIPSYIKKSNANLARIQQICKKYGADWYIVVANKSVPDVFSKKDNEAIGAAIGNLLKAASRAKVEYTKFIERIQLIPYEVGYTEQPEVSDLNRAEEMLEASMVVDKLKQYMTDREIAVCNGIMEDKSYSEIGKELGISKTTVADEVKGLRERIMKMVGKGIL